MATKEVFYNQYCKKCDYWKKSDCTDICNECLNNPCNENSHRPINYKGENVFITDKKEVS